MGKLIEVEVEVSDLLSEASDNDIVTEFINRDLFYELDSDDLIDEVVNERKLLVNPIVKGDVNPDLLFKMLCEITDSTRYDSADDVLRKVRLILSQSTLIKIESGLEEELRKAFEAGKQIGGFYPGNIPNHLPKDFDEWISDKI